MSLKGGISGTELGNIINDAEKGKTEAIDKLEWYIENGFLPREKFAPIIAKGRIEKEKKEIERSHKIKRLFFDIVSFVILFSSLLCALAYLIESNRWQIAFWYFLLWCWAVIYISKK